MSERDRYGGFLGVSSRGSGFFRLERIGGRWWLMTPDGHGFIATGFNHAVEKYLQASGNRDLWQATLRTPGAFEAMAIQDARAWNMTAIGYGGVRPKGKFPYSFRINFPGPSNWMIQPSFPDMFAPEFEEQCQKAVERDCLDVVDDPWLIGYWFNDCPEWPLFDRVSKRRPIDWTDAIKAMGPGSPGKRRYVELIRERHGGIESFNGAYGTKVSSFAALLSDADFIYAVPARPSARRADDEAFLAEMAERYLGVCHRAVRRVDADHLILGEIYDGNRGIPPKVLAAAARHSDLISTQFYGFFDDQAETLDAWHAQTGRPILLADSCFNCLTDAMPRVVSPRVESQAERARAFERYARQSLSVPYIVGWIWCGYMDGSLEVEPYHQHQGLMSVGGEKHEPLSSAITRTLADAYEIAVGAAPAPRG